MVTKKKLRKHNCLQNLNKLIESSMTRPFEWGKWDCALFAAEAVKVMTGVDFAESFRDTYNDPLSAAKALKKEGSGTLYKLMRKNFGNPVGWAKAWRGDIVYHKRSLGVCYGPITLFVGGIIGLGEEEDAEFEGLVAFPTKDMKHVFRVR